MFEPLSLFLSLLAVGLALYALWLARKTWRTVEAEGPLALWEDEVAELSEELARTAQQISAHLSRRREELSALLARAESATCGLQAPGVGPTERMASADEARANGMMARSATTAGDREGPAEAVSRATAAGEPFEMNHQVRLLASLGMSVAEIARQTRLPQEEILMRLNLSA